MRRTLNVRTPSTVAFSPQRWPRRLGRSRRRRGRGGRDPRVWPTCLGHRRHPDLRRPVGKRSVIWLLAFVLADVAVAEVPALDRARSGVRRRRRSSGRARAESVRDKGRPEPRRSADRMMDRIDADLALGASNELVGDGSSAPTRRCASPDPDQKLSSSSSRSRSNSNRS